MEDGFISKTRRKRDMLARQDLGEALVALDQARLASLDLPEPLAQAVSEARRLKGFEARRRQLQYIGRLMREVDPAPIRTRISAWQSATRSHTAWLHDLERWRERLIAEPAALTELASRHAGVDLQSLHTLIRNARQEKQAGHPPKHFRALFQALKTIFPEPVDDSSPQ